MLGRDPASDGFVTVVTLDPGHTARRRRPRTGGRRESSTGWPSRPAPGRPDAAASASLIDRITGQVEEDLRVGEGIALPVSFAVMVLVFGGFVAAGMPVVGAVASIAGALASLLGFSYVIDLDATVVNVVTVLGARPLHRLRPADGEPLPRGAARPRPGIARAEITREQVVEATAAHRRPGRAHRPLLRPHRRRSRSAACWCSRRRS